MKITDSLVRLLLRDGGGFDQNFVATRRNACKLKIHLRVFEIRSGLQKLLINFWRINLSRSSHCLTRAPMRAVQNGRPDLHLMTFFEYAVDIFNFEGGIVDQDAYGQG